MSYSFEDALLGDGELEQYQDFLYMILQTYRHSKEEAMRMCRKNEK